jgi:hypothetical protein
MKKVKSCSFLRHVVGVGFVRRIGVGGVRIGVGVGESVGNGKSEKL